MALERYADRVDGILRQLFGEAGPYDGPVSVIALGGYGRRHLCLYSDIDILVLFGGAIGRPEETFVNRFLNPLWDLGVVVGHQVRSLHDFEHLEVDNPEFLLALLHARPIAGTRAVFDQFAAVFHQADTHAFILRSLLGLIEARAYKQVGCFEAGVQFARTEGIVPAPESTHAVRCAIDEALRCKEEGKAETILFNLSGHGHFDMQAYINYFEGKLVDQDYDEADLATALAGLPAVAA